MWPLQVIRNFKTLWSKFLILANYPLAAVTTEQVMLYKYVSLLTPVCACLCLIQNQSTSKKLCHLCQTSVSLKSCCIKPSRGGWVVGSRQYRLVSANYKLLYHALKLNICRTCETNEWHKQNYIKNFLH